MRFLQGYANSAVCSATRLALITGRYQYRLRLGLEEPGSADIGLPPDHPTLPSLLKKARYGTSLIGKWHLGALPKFSPLKSGYDHFFGFRGGAVTITRTLIRVRSMIYETGISRLMRSATSLNCWGPVRSTR